MPKIKQLLTASKVQQSISLEEGFASISLCPLSPSWLKNLFLIPNHLIPDCL